MVGINYKTGLSLSPERKCVFTGNTHDLVSIGTVNPQTGDMLVSLDVIKYIAERELNMQEINSGQIDSLLSRAAAAEHTSIQLMSSELKNLVEVQRLLGEIVKSPLIQFSAAAVKEKFPTQKEILDTLIVKSEAAVEPEAPEHREPPVVAAEPVVEPVQAPEPPKVDVPVPGDIKPELEPEPELVVESKPDAVIIDDVKESETVKADSGESSVKEDSAGDELSALLAGLES